MTLDQNLCKEDYELILMSVNITLYCMVNYST